MYKTLCAGVVLIVVASAVPLAAAAETSSTATGISRLMNPAVSLNALFLGETSADVGEAEANRIAIQEIEMQLTSVVDPFWTADLVVAWHEEEAHGEEDHEEEAEEAHGTAHFVSDIEIATLRSTAMPAGLGLTLGKFYLPFGKHATLHTHQFPFVRAPIAVQSFLGDHGLTDVGAALDATVPLPWWSEITVYGVDGRAEIFNGAHRDLAFGGRWSHLWDVSENATLEFGSSYLTGPDADGSGHDRLGMAGFDLTFKWSSGERSHGPEAVVSGEVILPDYDHGEGEPYGYFFHARGRMSRNWWLGFGTGYAEDAEVVVSEIGPPYFRRMPDYKEYKANVVFAPSEFSALRAEVSYLDCGCQDMDDLRVSLQWNFTIGSHPAHMY